MVVLKTGPVRPLKPVRLELDRVRARLQVDVGVSPWSTVFIPAESVIVHVKVDVFIDSGRVRCSQEDLVTVGRVDVGVSVGQVGLAAMVGVAIDLRRHLPLDDGSRCQERPDFEQLDSEGPTAPGTS